MTNLKQQLAINSIGWVILLTGINISPVKAAIIVDNGTDIFAAITSDFDASVQLADEFTLTETSKIQEIIWYGQYSDGGIPLDDRFTIRFFEKVQGQYSSEPWREFNLDNINRIDLGLGLFGVNLFEYSATLTPLTLNPGNYLLSIVNNTQVEIDDWYWSASLPQDEDFEHFLRFEDEELWEEGFLGNMTFTLVGQATAVPEPSMIFGTVIAFGLGALATKSKK